MYWDRNACRWLNLDANLILAGPRAQIIEWAHEEADTNKLMARFEAFLRDWCQAESVTFHTVESNEPPDLVLKTSDYANRFPLLRQTGYITTESLARRRPDGEISLSKSVLTERNLAALIAAPRGSHSPSCVVALGHKHSLRPYTYPDIQLLIELVELMDNILTQARVAERTAQIEKMESAATMSRGLAHDLNNLATPVSSFLLHMENRVAAGSPEAEVLADAKHSIKVMQDYIRESLFFARRLVPDFQSLSMTELVNSTVLVTQNRAHARSVMVVVDSPIDIPFVADRALILRLMQNLVLNGIDATPHGGQVTLCAGLDEEGGIVFSVTDQGFGIPTEYLDRIFEPYFTTKDTGSDVRGLGLGLAISLKISGLHGGELKAGKASCGGAVFTFTLPANLKKADLPTRELVLA
jgi:signal transduction histidine kinase